MQYRGLFLILSATIAGLTLTAGASAQNSCNPATLKGAYGYTVTGIITANAQAPFVRGSFAAVGRIVFDGKGSVSTVRTFSDNGMVVPNDSGSGTYTLNRDCTGTFAISVSGPGATAILDLNFVLDDGDDQIRAIVTNQGFVLTLEGRKQKDR